MSNCTINAFPLTFIFSPPLRMIRNKIFIGDTLLKLDRKTEAAEYFLQASKAEPKTESDRKQIEDAQKKYEAATAKGWW